MEKNRFYKNFEISWAIDFAVYAEFLQSRTGHNLILVEKLPLKIGKLPILIGRTVAHR
ncbi:hypothetical protein T12_13771 [Trichinella patagoniensis]|uniref:Uncharacterized protein n=1 Tax=Trichinella patagoniensis TaxID=990121 RepID=A0A0V0Z2H5_9BILA|nr:hypothetical protein T12_13771 [Trichinella patagoniensis]